MTAVSPKLSDAPTQTAAVHPDAPASAASVDVLVIAHNESLNLPHCLVPLKGWTRRVTVIDSGSTDGTREIAEQHGARVLHHDWLGYAAQRNWALDHAGFTADWLLVLDADEVITPEVRAKIEEILARPVDQVLENGFFINRLTYFLDRPIRHCGYFPSWNLRLFKRGKGRYEDREVHEHVIIDDPLGYIREPMLHNDRRGLEHYFAKHNRYSTLEARQLYTEIRTGRSSDLANVSAQTRRRRWLKRHLTHSLPLPGLWRFLYMFVFRLGFLDGRAGFEFCKFIAQYDSMVALKLRTMLRDDEHVPTLPTATPARGLAVPEGAAPSDGAMDAPARPASAAGHAPTEVTQLHPESSPWTFREKAARAVWMLVGSPLFRLSFHNWYGFRAWLLRLFGARIGKGTSIRPSVHIEVPWMIQVDDDATVGDHAILYSLGRIHIGKRSIVSQYAHLCAGTHDYTDHRFPLLRLPITIEDDCWIGADAFVGPGVTMGKLSVLGARSSAYKDVPERKVCVGNPAKPIKDRELR